MKETGIYIHIPFCDHKCIYCDFYSITKQDNIEKYISALKKEISFYAEKYSSGRRIVSVFFGGGTPSFIEPIFINEIISFIGQKFIVDDEAEITLETNPGTVDRKKINEFKNAGVNRISVGIQSFNNDELKFLTRIHNKDEAVKTVYSVKESGFDNISIDLMFNLPNQTKEIWRSNLEQAATLPVKHISAYSLILERGTILNKMVLDGKVKIEDADYDAELYEIGIDLLEAKGFRQYEVSNFAKEGFECLHNKIYWEHKEYLGFGTSAHSFADKKRWWNFSNLSLYLRSIDEKNNAAANFEELDEVKLFEEYIMLNLRGKGINFSELKNKFGSDWINKNLPYFEELHKDEFVKMNDDSLFLTKKGYAVCDEILLNIL